MVVIQVGKTSKKWAGSYGRGGCTERHVSVSRRGEIYRGGEEYSLVRGLGILVSFILDSTKVNVLIIIIFVLAAT